MSITMQYFLSLFLCISFGLLAVQEQQKRLEELNKIVENKEINRSFDSEYVTALYEIAGIYVTIDSKKAIDAFKKAQTYDSNLPKVRMENGYMIGELSEEMDSKEARQVMQEMLLNSGICESSNDISFTKNTIKVKLKPCYNCQSK